MINTDKELIIYSFSRSTSWLGARKAIMADPLFMLSVFYFSRIHKHGTHLVLCLFCNQPKSEPEICSKKKFINEAAKWGDGGTNLISAFLKVKGLETFMWDKAREYGERWLKKKKGELIILLPVQLSYRISWDTCFENGGINMFQEESGLLTS